MEKQLLKVMTSFLFTLFACGMVSAQLGPGSYVSEATDEEHAIHIDVRALSETGRPKFMEGIFYEGYFISDLPLGIRGKVYGATPIELRVYSFHPDPAKRKELYHVFSTFDYDADWTANFDSLTWTDCWACTKQSNDIKANVETFLRELREQAPADPQLTYKETYTSRLPVIVELTVPQGGEVNAIQVPGASTNTLDYYFEPLDIYDIPRVDYYGLPVYALRGGMSAEYSVQKSLADLDKGISHTWAPRDKNGEPDLVGGGPVPVYGREHFLDSSVQRTVELYNTHLGSSTSINTVIISTGIASIPYLASSMKAAVLPLHFLVSIHSIGQVDSIVSYANQNGYSCYATTGYDHSTPDVGVAWIKLLELPDAYLQFLSDHNVQNVILAGMDERGLSESASRKIETANMPPEEYGEGAIYMMSANAGNNYVNLERVYTDYGFYSYQKLKLIADWEGGITNTQIENFSASIRNLSLQIHTITSLESVRYYEMAIDLALELWKKNSGYVGSDPITGVALNEYLIGYPMYEAKKGQVPFLYWQGAGSQGVNSARVMSVLQHKVRHNFPSISENDFKGLAFQLNAKANRTPFKDSLNARGVTHVTMNSWQKGDVWDPSDGYDAPVEVAASDIVNSSGGAASYGTWVDGLSAISISDLDNLASLDDEEIHDKAATHPDPDQTLTVKDFSDDGGPEIKKYVWDPNPYWQMDHYAYNLAYHDVSFSYPGTFKGWLDNVYPKGDERKQDITIAEFDLTNTGAEYELKVDYVFNPHDQENFPYDPANGTAQEMACFEYVNIPKTEWLDIPSRIMARNGAVWVVNGTVYDWDYNGMPGVVPFVKKDSAFKAQPQILSYKAEAYFAWNWGSTKSVAMGHRPVAIDSVAITATLDSLYHTETAGYANALSGMTYMTDAGLYDIEGLQPQWMKNWPAFTEEYLGPSGTSVRCYLGGLAGNSGCADVLERTGGVVPPGERWNDCGSVEVDTLVQRISALAYRQYDQLFDQVPNSRTFVAVKGNQLDIGIIDGVLGNYGDPRGILASKTSGMRNWEVSNFVQYKGYDHFMNLDGGSSTQMWLNGRGPLHDWEGYPLKKDNQGPYYSRLGSTFIMLIPKFHANEVPTSVGYNNSYLSLDNSSLSYDYDDEDDHLDKAFVSLSPMMDSLTTRNPLDTMNYLENNAGILAGNFKIDGIKDNGAILFSVSEDSYYPDTKGEKDVIPEYRNLVIAGVGKVPTYLLEKIQNKETVDSLEQINFDEFHYRNVMWDYYPPDNRWPVFYYFKMYDGKITELFYEFSTNKNKYRDDEWHSFFFDMNADTLFDVYVDNVQITGEVNYHEAAHPGFLYNSSTNTHAMIGGVNVDGRFVTGNAVLGIDNFLIAVGKTGYDHFSSTDRAAIRSVLESHVKLPIALNAKYQEPHVYALTFEESEGQHSFSLESTQNVRFYGLNLNTERVSTGGGSRMADNEEVQVQKLDKNIGAPGINVYPNPSAGHLNIDISLEEASPVEIMVYDMNGRLVWAHKGNLEAGSYAMYIADLKRYVTNSGLYLLKVSSRSMEQTSKLIIQ